MLRRGSLVGPKQIKSLQINWSGFKSLVRQMQADDQTSSWRVLSSHQAGKSAIASPTRRHRPDYLIVLFMSILMLIGLILIFAISPQRANLINNSYGYQKVSENFFFVKQALVLAACVITFLVVAKTPVRWWHQHAHRLLGFGLALCLGLLVLSKISSSLAVCTYGACRWLSLGPLGTIQVSEALKFCLLIFFASMWAFFAKRQQLSHKANLVFSSLIILASLLIVVVFQNDLGTGASMMLILLSMLWIAGVSHKFILGLLIIVLLGSFSMILIKPHRISRLETFIRNDDSQMTDENRHIIESKIAIGSGGFWGLGIGKSIQSTGYLPEAINDSIFAIIGEVFGFVGSIAVIGVFTALMWRLLQGAIYSQDKFNQLVFVGAFGWIFAHLFINIGSMIGVIPMTGITLPFLSYGGTSMIFVAAILGLAFNLSQYTGRDLSLTDGAAA